VAHPSGLQVFRKQLLALKCHSIYKPAAVVLESRNGASTGKGASA